LSRNETKARHLADLCRQLGKPAIDEGIKLKFNYTPLAILCQITADCEPNELGAPSD